MMNSLIDLDLEPRTLIVELAQDIVIPIILCEVISKSINKCRRYSDD